MDTNSAGVTLIGLSDDNAQREWLFSDDTHDIAISRVDDHILSIDLAITHADGGSAQLNTQIKVLPGQRIKIGQTDREEILLEIAATPESH